MTRDEAISAALRECVTAGPHELFLPALRLAGFAIVPVEPTESMKRAAPTANPITIWNVMIAAYEKEMGDG